MAGREWSQRWGCVGREGGVGRGRLPVYKMQIKYIYKHFYKYIIIKYIYWLQYYRTIKQQIRLWQRNRQHVQSVKKGHLCHMRHICQMHYLRQRRHISKRRRFGRKRHFGQGVTLVKGITSVKGVTSAKGVTSVKGVTSSKGVTSGKGVTSVKDITLVKVMFGQNSIYFLRSNT